MTETPTEDGDKIRIYRQIGDDTATALRAAIAAMGFPRHCRFKACRRSRTCATRELLCWQVNHKAMNRQIGLAIARAWQASRERGEEQADWTPEQVRTFERMLAEAAGERDAGRDRIAAQIGEGAS